jgi:hypothetical protein
MIKYSESGYAYTHAVLIQDVFFKNFDFALEFYPFKMP